MTTSLLLAAPNPFTSAIQAMEPHADMVAVVVGALAGVSLFGGLFLLFLAIRRPRHTVINVKATEVVTIPPYSVRAPTFQAPPVRSTRAVVSTASTRLVDEPPRPPVASLTSDETGPASAVVMAASVAAGDLC